MEQWADIAGFEGNYQISNFGNVKSHKRLMSPCPDCDGYMVVSLRQNKKQVTKKVHRLVASAFLNNHDSKPMVNHIDSNRKNNHVSNLEWCTAKENLHHSIKAGLSNPNGGGNPNSKVVIDFYTGIFYDCAKDAAKAHSINYSTLKNKLNGNHKNNFPRLKYI